MPAAVPITYKQFCEIEYWCFSHGCVEIQGREVVRLIQVYGLKRYHVILEGEVGFKYFENGLMVKIWTSCLRSQVAKCRREPSISDDVIVSRPSGKDMGWVVIADEFNRAQYFARPTLRTKNFVKTFIQRIGITIRKVQYRPICEECGKWMKVFRKLNRATFWACFHQRTAYERRKPVWRDWDFALKPRMLKIAKGWRKEFHRYLEREHEKGNIPRHAAEIRNRWVATKNPHQ